MVERLLCKQDVVGSNPSGSTMIRLDRKAVQLSRPVGRSDPWIAFTSFREIISVVGCIRVRMQRRRVFGPDRNGGVVQVKYTNQSPFFRKGRE